MLYLIPLSIGTVFPVSSICILQTVMDLLSTSPKNRRGRRDDSVRAGSIQTTISPITGQILDPMRPIHPSPTFRS